MRPGARIAPFKGGPLSQWKHAPFHDDTGTWYYNAEQYMMASKARMFGDEESLVAIMSTTDSRRMKAIGRRVKNFDQEAWDGACWGIVYRANKYKFNQSPAARRALLSFPPDCVFAEGNQNDTLWAIGLDYRDPAAMDYRRWRGKNMLGFILTKVRDEIIKGE